jgi:hypothetical protein
MKPIRSTALQFIGGLLALLCASISLPAHCDELSFKTLLMPGKLIEGHAKLEAECAKCHVSFAKQAQDQLCVQCHDVIGADIAAKKGFHGKLEHNTALACKQCHTDHKGRTADIVGLDRDNFNHGATDFPLEGKHGELQCGRCHAAGKKIRAASSECYSCHKVVDKHRGALGQRCGSCHNPNSWKETRFDHSTTKFALKGNHQQASCGACHPSERYKQTPTACVACHAINDVHRGANGRECQRCHNERGWKQSTFDHARDTHFALLGAHAATNCNACHREGKFDVKLSTSCVSCHRNDDTHKGKNGDKCESCHNESAWSKQKFDHNRDTKFMLRGKHSDASCISCHRGNLHDALPKNCFGCHKLDDVHKGQQGEQCDKCHNESGWKEKLAFNHKDTQFPLTGLHAVVPCEGCHISNAFKGAPKQCVGCHKAVDKHKGTLGGNCASCHNTNGWKRWKFDHATQTEFALNGAHAKLQCGDCHRTPAETAKIAKECYSCHVRDDEHDGKFGRYCERCHNTTNFKQVEISR